MPLPGHPRRDRSILEHVLLHRLLDSLRHGGSLRPLGNHGRPDRLLVRTFAGQLILPPANLTGPDRSYAGNASVVS